MFTHNDLAEFRRLQSRKKRSASRCQLKRLVSEMYLINLELLYDLNNDSFDISGNAKDPDYIVKEFLMTQIGKGVDNSKANEKEKYAINIQLDLEFDTFSCAHDCGNLGLRDGILQRFISR